MFLDVRVSRGGNPKPDKYWASRGKTGSTKCTYYIIRHADWVFSLWKKSENKNTWDVFISRDQGKVLQSDF